MIVNRRKTTTWTGARIALITGIMALWLAACGASASQVVPTARPTPTITASVTPSSTPDSNATPSATPPRAAATATGGPSPTPLIGPTRTRAPAEATFTPVPNPNAPRIEFFTTDSPAAAPGSTVTLFWSTRGARGVVIYQLDRRGNRLRVWNDRPDGNITVQTRQSDRGQLDFLLIVGEGDEQVERILSIPLVCPVTWFFNPAPQDCPDTEAVETRIVEQQFERGRMIYVAEEDVIYVLFNDGLEPRWAVFTNRYDPAIHPEIDEGFPGLQPIGILGFRWRNDDTVRNRLGVPLEPEIAFDGFVQTANDAIYISSTNGTVLQVLPDGSDWQLITVG